MPAPADVPRPSILVTDYVDEVGRAWRMVQTPGEHDVDPPRRFADFAAADRLVATVSDSHPAWPLVTRAVDGKP